MLSFASKCLAGLLSLGTLFAGSGQTPAATQLQAPWRQSEGATMPIQATRPMDLARSHRTFWRYTDGLNFATTARPPAAPITREDSPRQVALTPAPAPAPAPASESPAPEVPAPVVTQPAPQTPAPVVTQPAPQTPAPVVTQPAPQTPAPVVTQPAPQLPAGLNAEEQQMVQLVNAERTRAGLSPLEVDVRLVQTARAKSQDMVNGGYFSHNSPTLGSPFDQMRAAGIRYMTAGENIAGNQSVAAAHQALMNSAGHRANILNRNFTRIGIGIVHGGRYGTMFTQQFIGL